MINEIGFSTYHEVIAGELRAALRRYFDKWDEILEKPATEQPRYDSTIEQYRISVIVLCSSLVEYSINFYLGTKCDAAKFDALERKPFFSKWTEVPKQFAPTYHLPPKSKLADDLAKLIARRNVIVHAKPAMSIDGDNRHQGNITPLCVSLRSLHLRVSPLGAISPCKSQYPLCYHPPHDLLR